MATYRRSRLTTWLLRCGLAAGPLFTTVFLADGATREDYSPMRHPVSSLALGSTGWLQTANFFAAGSLMLGYGVGTVRATVEDGDRRRLGPLLIALSGAGMIGSGVFVTDPVGGYPPGTPDLGEPTLRGQLHDMFALPVFLGWPIVFLLFAHRFARRGERQWQYYSLGTALASIGLLVASGKGFAQEPGYVEVGGLLQRLTIVSGLTWHTLHALHLLRDRENE